MHSQRKNVAWILVKNYVLNFTLKSPLKIQSLAFSKLAPYKALDTSSKRYKLVTTSPYQNKA